MSVKPEDLARERLLRWKIQQSLKAACKQKKQLEDGKESEQCTLKEQTVDGSSKEQTNDPSDRSFKEQTNSRSEQISFKDSNHSSQSKDKHPNHSSQSKDKHSNDYLSPPQRSQPKRSALALEEEDEEIHLSPLKSENFHSLPRQFDNSSSIDPLDAFMNSLEPASSSSQFLPSEPLDDDSLLESNPPSLTNNDNHLSTSLVSVGKVPKITFHDTPPFHAPDCTPFRKAFISSVPASSSSNQVQKPPPLQNWHQAGLSNATLETLARLKLNTPTPIQSQAIPAILAGFDVIGIAKTGSGKTLAFLLPLLRHVIDQRPLAYGEGPIAVILSPTRELTLQIYDQLRIFTCHTSVRAVACYGGPPLKDQIASLKRGAEILVSTPGRLIDLLCANAGRVTNLARTTFLVVDEADRMFDVGFEPQVLKIAACTRPDRQTVLFSATFPRAIQGLAKRIMSPTESIHISTIASCKEGRAPCSEITQIVHILEEEEDKFPLLLQIIGEFHLKHGSESKILIFVQRQESADCLLRDLLRKGYHCCSLHGGKDQSDRDCAISDFKSGIIPIMIATSVASRGLDVADLQIVINYDCPLHLEDYVHRIGRTGRAGRSGTAYTFITRDQPKQAAQIEKALSLAGLSVPAELKSLAEQASESQKSGVSSGGYGGKGLERLDEERAHFKSVQSLAFLGGGGEEGEEGEEIKNDHNGEGKLNSSIRPPPPPSMISQNREFYQALERIEARLKDLQNHNSPSSFSVIKDPVAILNARFGFSTGPAEENGQIIAIPESNSSTGEKKFCCELTINDYPQQARWRVTNRDNLSAITAATGIIVTVRGTWIPPGTVAKRNATSIAGADGNERKLFLYIEGPSPEAVAAVREQIQSILNQG